MRVRGTGLLRSEAGAVAPTVALSLFGLIAAGGLAFDYARLASLDTELQQAADHAALAAASQLDGETGACARAAQAASAMVVNETRFANDGQGITIDVANEATCDAADTIRFYQDKPKTTPATSDADAHFVEVTVEARRADYAFTPIAGVLSSGNLIGTAYAGVSSAICKVPPLMICNPDEGVGGGDFNVANYVGKGILAKEGGGGAMAPGNFGFLEVGATPSASSLREVFGHLNTSFQCVAEDGVTTAPGNMTSVSTAINTRFDIYDSGWAAGCGGACPAAQNTVKDLVRTNAAPSGNNCALHNQGWRQVAAAERYLPDPVTRTDNNVTAMGHPRDICHAVSDGGDCSNGVVGDGNWDRDTYFRVNHGYATTAAWQAATGMTNPTRYEVYRWELSSGNLGTRAVGSLYSYKAPICSPSGGVGPPAEADRRVTALAVINCAAEGVAGHVSGVKVQKWVDIFFVEPSIARDRTDTDELYVEVIGLTTTAGGNQQAQLIRRDVPYLIE